MVVEEDDEGNVISEVQKKYSDLSIVDELAALPNGDPDKIEAVDLTYFFENTLDPAGDYEQGVDTIFYSDCYLPYSHQEGDVHQNISVGRQFFCQYPDEATIVRCAVMRDYGENNKYVMKMWENFKSNPLPVWAIILFSIILAGIVGIVIYFVVNNSLKKTIHKKRIENK